MLILSNFNCFHAIALHNIPFKGINILIL